MTKRDKMGAFLTGVGTAFALFPTGQIDQFAVGQPISVRVSGNFVRVGNNLRRAYRKFEDEQGIAEHSPESKEQSADRRA